MLARRFARGMLATWFVARGVDAALHPIAHTDESAPSLDKVTAGVARTTGIDLDQYVGGRRLIPIVQAHGAATALAGLWLASGRSPRVAGLTLAALSVPLVLANLPVRVPGESKLDREARRDRFWHALAMTGGALVAGLDTQGRPGIAWRARQYREARRSADTLAE